MDGLVILDKPPKKSSSKKDKKHKNKSKRKEETAAGSGALDLGAPTKRRRGDDGEVDDLSAAARRVESGLGWMTRPTQNLTTAGASVAAGGSTLSESSASAGTLESKPIIPLAASNLMDEEDLPVASDANLQEKLIRANQTDPLSFQNPRFGKHLVAGLGEHSFLMLATDAEFERNSHCIIASLNPSPSLVQAPRVVYEEIERFKSSVERMFAAQNGASVVFLETVVNPDRIGQRTRIDCFSVDEKYAELLPMMFKKALLESDEEWSDNPKVLDPNARGGIRHTVPHHMPYFSVEIRGGGYAPEHFVHIIEGPRFPSSFGVQVLRGALEDESDGVAAKTARSDHERIRDFLRAWQPFDWTVELDD